MKTFIKYPGGKSGELEIINENKPHQINRYFEPFVGGGSVYFDFEIKNSFINDKSKELMLLYEYVKNKDEEFFMTLETINSKWKEINRDNYKNFSFDFIDVDMDLNNYFMNEFLKDAQRKELSIEKQVSKGVIAEPYETIETSIKAAFYYTIRAVYNNEDKSDVLKAVTYYFMREYAYAAMFRFSNTGKFNVPYGGKSYNKKSFDSKIVVMKNCDMSGTKIYNEDYLNFLKRFDFKSTDFIFVDPPYDSEFSEYDQSPFDKECQEKLAIVLSKLDAKVMVVIKNTDFIFDLYEGLGFYITSFDKKYSVNIQNRNERNVKHLMITNYSLGEK